MVSTTQEDLHGGKETDGTYACICTLILNSSSTLEDLEDAARVEREEGGPLHSVRAHVKPRTTFRRYLHLYLHLTFLLAPHRFSFTPIPVHGILQ